MCKAQWHVRCSQDLRAQRPRAKPVDLQALQHPPGGDLRARTRRGGRDSHVQFPVSGLSRDDCGSSTLRPRRRASLSRPSPFFDVEAVEPVRPSEIFTRPCKTSCRMRRVSTGNSSLDAVLRFHERLWKAPCRCVVPQTRSDAGSLPRSIRQT